MITRNRPLFGRNGLGALLLAAFSVMSWPAQAESESQLTAAFIYNFTKYVLWPVDTEKAGGDLRVCITGESEQKVFTGLKGRPVRAFHLDVKFLKPQDNLDFCHILYFRSKPDTALLEQATARSILTISNYEQFIDQGGVIQLFEEKRRLRFNVNLIQAKAAELQISAKLLQLAGRVVK